MKKKGSQKKKKKRKKKSLTHRKTTLPLGQQKNERKNSRKRPILLSSTSPLRRVGSLGVVRSPSVRVSHTRALRTRARRAYRHSRRGRKDGDEARLYGARTRASKSGGRSSGLCCGRQLRGWRSGLHPRRGWRGVDQYVKIESDATHPAPQAPLRASTAARSGWGYRGSIDWFVTHASFSSTLRGTSTGPRIADLMASASLGIRY